MADINKPSKKYPLPPQEEDDIVDIPEEEDTPKRYPNKSLNDAMKQRWNSRHHTADRVNISNPRTRVKRSDRK
jgi:hypothetical protein